MATAESCSAPKCLRDVNSMSTRRTQFGRSGRPSPWLFQALRCIALPSVTVAALAKHKMVQELEREGAGDRWRAAGCATLLIAQGVHPRYVMEILGHSQIGLTMNTYGHVFLAVQREAATKMDEILTRVDVRVAVKEGLEHVQ
jgi:integrase